MLLDFSMPMHDTHRMNGYPSLSCRGNTRKQDSLIPNIYSDATTNRLLPSRHIVSTIKVIIFVLCFVTQLIPTAASHGEIREGVVKIAINYVIKAYEHGETKSKIDEYLRKMKMSEPEIEETHKRAIEKMNLQSKKISAAHTQSLPPGYKLEQIVFALFNEDGIKRGMKGVVKGPGEKAGEVAVKFEDHDGSSWSLTPKQDISHQKPKKMKQKKHPGFKGDPEGDRRRRLAEESHILPKRRRLAEVLLNGVVKVILIIIAILLGVMSLLIISILLHEQLRAYRRKRRTTEYVLPRYGSPKSI